MPSGVTTTHVHAGRREVRREREIVLYLAAEFGARFAQVAGDFSAWVPLSMAPVRGGGFSLTLLLEQGRRWRYRYLLDGELWMNDPAAVEFATGPNGAVRSVLIS